MQEERILRGRNVALASVFAALYAVLVFTFAGLSFQLVQMRVADALIPISILFGWPAVLGVTFGCAVANLVTPMPSVITDVILGSAANFFASLLAWKVAIRIRGKIGELVGCLVATAIVTFVVGSYLALITDLDFWMWWLGIGAGSILSVTLVGYLLVQALRRAGVKT